ncbi:MAG TPA: YggS family pyridoxal phosphate-dependent enzyme [Rhizomicrobium sp.]|nr:YggS family pyridoxal phosphate-dependent enzyme [Rhizomicrobium sp.]
MSPEPLSHDSAAALGAILSRIEAARKAALKPAPRTRLIAVSKAHGEAEIVPVLEAGHRIFGENRVQEAKAKWPALRARYPGIELHLIGPLQTNKAREAVELFDAIHSVDRPRLADALKQECERAGKAPLLFVQVNTGEEPQKAGVAPGQAQAFIRYCRETAGLKVSGLMCIPPAGQAPAPHFALLAKIAQENEAEFLSMGMSADFETAIRFGATHVRVGSAIFGERV